MSAEIERVIHEGQIMALILRHDYQSDGVHFFTPPEFSQQLAYMKHPRGHVIQAHIHNQVQRQIVQTQEVLLVRRGKIQVDFYDQSRHFLETRVLTEGDVILLVMGGHGFKVLEDAELVEIKQGPYAGVNDKTLFDATT